jgi:hypothetical protein
MEIIFLNCNVFLTSLIKKKEKIVPTSITDRENKELIFPGYLYPKIANT